VGLYRRFVGGHAAEHVLQDAIRPDIVLAMFGARLGRNVRVYRGLMLHETNNDFSNLVVGNDVHIGKGVVLDLSGRLEIGDRVGIGMGARIFTHQNLGDSSLRHLHPPVKGDVRIADDVVLSANCLVLYPTRLAAGTLVSAGSVVRGVYTEPCVLIGNPARALPLEPQVNAQKGSPEKAP
jgi:acetyltransferase-like isoleucine patch superfamily enzyme